MQIILRACYEVPIKLAKGVANYIYSSTIGSYMGREVKVSSVVVKNNIVYFPRNSVKFKKTYGIIPFVDKRVKVPLVTLAAKVNDTFKFREYQKAPVKELIAKFESDCSDIVFNCDTGFGKTFLIPYIITKLQQKTLIITDRVLLNEQMISSIKANSNLIVTLLGKDTNLLHFDVCVTTFQFLHRQKELLKTLSDSFGLLILDEVHIVGASTYLEAVHSINSYYRLGLSATPTRSDGLTEIITDTLEYKVIGVNPNKLIPEVNTIDIEMAVSMTDNNFKKSVGIFLRDDDISRVVVEYIRKLQTRNRKILLVIDEKITQEHYATLLNSVGIVTYVVNSATKNKISLFKDIEEDRAAVLIGCKVMEKGVDVPRLDTLLFLYGSSSKEGLEQLIGRISRTHPNKNKPIVVDFMFQGILGKSSDSRYGIYKDLESKGKVTTKYFFFDTNKFRKTDDNN